MRTLCKLLLWLGATAWVLGWFLVAVHAQTPGVAVPTSVDVLVLPPGSDPVSGTAVATRNTTIGPTTPNCNIVALPVPGPSPLVNPTHAYFDDPFNVGRFCFGDMPQGLAAGNGYFAVVVAKADQCTVNGSTVLPCPSPRSIAATPPFNIQAVLNPPATPMHPVLRP